MFILVQNAGSKLTVVTSNHLECPLKDMSEITWHGPPELTTVIALNGTVNGHLKSLYEIIVDNSMKTKLVIKNMSMMTDGVVRCLNGNEEQQFCTCKQSKYQF